VTRPTFEGPPYPVDGDPAWTPLVLGLRVVVVVVLAVWAAVRILRGGE